MICLQNPKIVKALEMVDAGYRKNPEKPFACKANTKYHQDEVRDCLTGAEFQEMYLYVKQRGNTRLGCGLNSLHRYQEMVQPHLGNLYVTHHPDVFECFREDAFGAQQTVTLSEWREAVLAVYKSAMTLMVIHHELDTKRSTFDSLFDIGQN